jgi:hypothetical protein
LIVSFTIQLDITPRNNIANIGINFNNFIVS